MKNIMFVCRNRTYALMAEAWMRHYVGDAIAINSCGWEGNLSIQDVIQTMDEVDLHISMNNSQLLDDYQPNSFDAVVSLGSTSTRLPDDWMMRQFFDEWLLSPLEPSSINSYRQVRDEIKDHVEVMLMRLEIY
ncbi:protein tyrosine phosphatase [Pseudanabaena biceps PCC 7429]|uniref:Protein tyrosine phosphatase n=3 Tax=Pseudanabaenaceae TaxID=1890436 RepID=L8MUF5_9CYAN|nr:protein tyrosine phosphatase [Pseudanabaena biceps PCC 7429]